MWNYDISVQFYICDSCLTVIGCNFCGSLDQSALKLIQNHNSKLQ